MATSEVKLDALRQRMIDDQLRARGITHAGVLAAFARVPRERFVVPEHFYHAYEDAPLTIGHGQTISQPYIVALMLEELDPQPRHRVLEVGAGSGYQTALLAQLVSHVYAIELIEELTERAMAALGDVGVGNVTLYTGDGSVGCPQEAPFDRIICGAGGPDVPAPWIDQLADGGRIVMPIGEIAAQMLVCVHKEGQRIRRREICPVRFVKLLGREGWGGRGD